MSDGDGTPNRTRALVVTGMMLNTVGIVLTSPGWARYALMACGLAMLVAALAWRRAPRG